MNRIILFFKTKAPYYGLARYLLGGVMISFGYMKIIGMQMHTIAGPASSYAQTLEHLTGIQLTWAFLGYSTWFQCILGIFEFIPACLLLFRRTAFAGTVLLMPMTVSVFFINYALHLWYDTRIESLILLILNISLLLFEWEKVKRILGVLCGSTKKYKYMLQEVIVAAIVILLPVMRKTNADYGRSFQNELTGNWFNRHPFEYTLVEEKINDSTLPRQRLQSFFGAWHEYSEFNDSANNWDGYKQYTTDTNNHTLHIAAERNRISKLRGQGYYFLTGDFSYELYGDSVLVLRQTTGDTKLHTWRFTKREMNPNCDF